MWNAGGVLHRARVVDCPEPLAPCERGHLRGARDRRRAVRERCELHSTAARNLYARADDSTPRVRVRVRLRARRRLCDGPVLRMRRPSRYLQGGVVRKRRPVSSREPVCERRARLGRLLLQSASPRLRMPVANRHLSHQQRMHHASAGMRFFIRSTRLSRRTDGLPLAPLGDARGLCRGHQRR